MPPPVSSEFDPGITKPIAVPGRQPAVTNDGHRAAANLEPTNDLQRHAHRAPQPDGPRDDFGLYYGKKFNADLDKPAIPSASDDDDDAASAAATGAVASTGLSIKKTRRNMPYVSRKKDRSDSGITSPKSSTATLLMPKKPNPTPYLDTGIGDEYVPDYAPDSSPSVRKPTANQALGAPSNQSLIGSEYLPPGEVVGIDGSKPSSASTKSDNDTGVYPPRRESLEAAVAILASPTFGLSESEWKAIPFSTRRKLRTNIGQASSELLPTDLASINFDIPSDSNSIPDRASRVSLSSMGGTSPLSRHLSLDQRQSSLPFTSRMRERAMTLNSDTSVLANLRKGAHFTIGTTTGAATGTTGPTTSPSSVTISRSASLSTSPMSFSPAYQYLSRFGMGSESAANNGDTGEMVGNYAIGKLIGYGAFSQVREAVTMEQGEKVVRAVKIVKKHSSGSSQEKMEQIQHEFSHEVSIWKQLDHPNILHLLSVEEDDNAIYCFSEKITGGTLLDYVKHIRQRILIPTRPSASGHQPWFQHFLPRTLGYLREMADALIYLHQTMFIVHRDFKLENCLLEETEPGLYKVLLCDFGMCDYYEEAPLPAAEYGYSKPSSVGSDKSSKSGSSISSMRSERSTNRLLIGPSDTSSIIKPSQRIRRASSVSSNGGGNPKTNQNDESMDVDEENDDDNNDPGFPLSREISSSRPSSSVSISSATSTNNCGSLPYASPQLLTSNSPIVQPHVDIWAFGVVMYAMMMGKLPWMHGFAPRLRMMIMQSKWNDSNMENIYGKEMTDIVRGCLEVDVTKRLSIREVRDRLWSLND